MKLSKYYLPTLREAPAEAVTKAHTLVLRSAMARSAGVGVFSLLPLGEETVSRLAEELEVKFFAEGLKVSAASLQDRAIWEQSGRWARYGSDMFKVADRYNRQSVLAAESEEAFLALVSGELKSYRQLPAFFYEEEKRFQDVKKPKYGFADARERRVLDGYSYFADAQEAAAFSEDMRARAEDFLAEEGVRYHCIETDEAYSFYALAEGYEEALAWTEKDAYFRELAPVTYPAPAAQDAQEAEEIHTPGAATIRDLSEMIGIEPARCAKAVDLSVAGKPVFAFVPGDRGLNMKKLARYLEVDEADIDMLDEETIEKMGSFPGFTGPIGLSDEARIIVDRSLTGIANLVVGANKFDHHIQNVNYGRDFGGEVADDLLTVEEGDATPGGEPLSFGTGFLIATVRKPSSFYGQAMNVSYIDQSGKEAPFVASGICWDTTALFAALLENHSDEKGIAFPVGMGAYDAVITVVNTKKAEQNELAEALYEKLRAEGVRVLLDDRAERAGVKFNDRDLIGIPLQISVGKRAAEDVVEYKRRGGEMEEIDAEAAVSRAISVCKEA